MIQIIFEAHSTTHDNELEIASGWRDVGLTSIGREQAYDLGQRYRLARIHRVYTSDLRRAYLTAEMAFSARPDIPVIRDPRLRECSYGSYDGKSTHIVSAMRAHHITEAFPGGESYMQCMERMRSFLIDLRAQTRDGETVMIIGHRATHYGLEHHLNGADLRVLVTAPFRWQPGWRYEMN